MITIEELKQGIKDNKDLFPRQKERLLEDQELLSIIQQYPSVLQNQNEVDALLNLQRLAFWAEFARQEKMHEACQSGGIAVVNIVLNTPKWYEQLDKTWLLRIAALFPEEPGIIKLFVQRAKELAIKVKKGESKIFRELRTEGIRLIRQEDFEKGSYTEGRLLKLMLSVKKIYRTLSSFHLSMMVDGFLASQGSGDSTKDYATKGEIMEMILDFAIKNPDIRNILNQALLEEWVQYEHRMAYCEYSRDIYSKVSGSPELLDILHGISRRTSSIASSPEQFYTPRSVSPSSTPLKVEDEQKPDSSLDFFRSPHFI